jgi:hypothetical protein
MVAVAYAPALVLLAGGHLRRLASAHAVRVWESFVWSLFTRVVVRSVACHALDSLPSLRAASAGPGRTPRHPATPPCEPL